MKKILFVAIAAVCLVSCVDDNYDLDKLDRTMALFEEEGVEIPLPDSAQMDLNLFGDGGDSDIVRCQSSTWSLGENEVVDFSKYDSETLEKGIKLQGEFRFDFSDFYDFIVSPVSDIQFSNGTCFKILVNNGVSVPVAISCEVVDGKSKVSLGRIEDIMVPVGERSEVDIPLNSIGLRHLPEEVILRNFVLKAAPVKSTVTGVLSLVSADFYFNPVFKAGTMLEFERDYSDLFSESDYYDESFDIKSCVVSAILTTDLPIRLELSTEGDISASLVLDGPTPAGGSSVELSLKCPGGIGYVDKFILHIKCYFKEDIDFDFIDDYFVEITPLSLKLDEGITVEL